MSILGASAILGGVQALGTAASAFGQASANRTNLKLAREAREHDVNMWNQQNAYNTPQMQMQRMKEAGLNPNLVYGSGAAQTTASTPQKAPVPEVNNALAPLAQMNIAPYLSLSQDWEVKKAQISNMAAQKDYIQQQTANLALEAINKGHVGRKLSWELGHKQNLAPHQLDAAKANISKTLANIDLSRQKQQFTSELHPNQMLYMHNRAKAMGLDVNLKNLEYQMQSELKPYGVTINDNMLFRFLAPYLRSGKNFLNDNVESFKSMKNRYQSAKQKRK